VNGRSPHGATFTLWASIGSPLLAAFLVWLVFALVFRRKFLDIGHKPPVVNGERFVTFWSNLKVRTVQ
jgi:hypothetical protein